MKKRHFGSNSVIKGGSKGGRNKSRLWRHFVDGLLVCRSSVRDCVPFALWRLNAPAFAAVTRLLMPLSAHCSRTFTATAYEQYACALKFHDCCISFPLLCCWHPPLMRSSACLACMQNLTIRDNILFGLPYEEAKYKQVWFRAGIFLKVAVKI